MRSASALLFALLVGCSTPPADDASIQGPEHLWAERRPSACRMVLNRPVSHRLLRISHDGVVSEEAPCKEAICIVGAKGVVVVPDGHDPQKARALYDDGTTRVMTRSDSPVRSPVPGVLAHGSTVLHAKADEGYDIYRHAPDRTVRLPPVPLSSNERVLQMKATRDAIYLHLGKPRSTPKQRRGWETRWVVARDGAYADSGAPVIERERLCGTLEIVDDIFHFVRPDGARLELTMRTKGGSSTDVTCDGPLVTIASWKPTFVERIDTQTLTRARVDLPKVLRVWIVSDTIYALHPVDGFLVVKDGQPVPHLPRRAGHDLAGAPAPDGAVLERVDFATDGALALVVERYRTPMCELIDLVHLIDVATKTAKTLRSGHGLRVAPDAAAGAFFVVESDQETTTVQ